MDDTTQGTPTPDQAADEIKNLKAEMNRKYSNLEESNAKLIAQLERMMNPAPAQAPEKKLSDLLYSDPEAYARIVSEQAEAKAEAKLQKRDAELAKQNATLQALAQEFPELHQGDHELTQKALAIYNSMSAEDKMSPMAQRAAVKEAALDLGIKPKSKRSASDSDGFTLGSSPQGNSGKASRRGKEDIDPLTKAFAEAVGADLEKVKARVNKRKTFTSWE